MPRGPTELLNKLRNTATEASREEDYDIQSVKDRGNIGECFQNFVFLLRDAQLVHPDGLRFRQLGKAVHDVRDDPFRAQLELNGFGGLNSMSDSPLLSIELSPSVRDGRGVVAMQWNVNHINEQVGGRCERACPIATDLDLGDSGFHPQCFIKSSERREGVHFRYCGQMRKLRAEIGGRER